MFREINFIRSAIMALLFKAIAFALSSQELKGLPRNELSEHELIEVLKSQNQKERDLCAEEIRNRLNNQIYIVSIGNVENKR